MNEITIIGRLGKDPELQEVGKDNIAVCRFNVAVNRPKQKNEEEAKTDWFRCVAWRGAAEYVSKYAKRGKLISVHGAMQQNNYTNKDGEEVKDWVLQASNVEILEWPDKNEKETVSSSYDKREESQSEQIKMTPIADDSLPF